MSLICVCTLVLFLRQLITSTLSAHSNWQLWAGRVDEVE